MKKEIRKQEVEAVKEQDLEQVNGGNQLPNNILSILAGGSLDNNKVAVAQNPVPTNAQDCNGVRL